MENIKIYDMPFAPGTEVRGQKDISKAVRVAKKFAASLTRYWNKFKQVVKEVIAPIVQAAEVMPPSNVNNDLTQSIDTTIMTAPMPAVTPVAPVVAATLASPITAPINSAAEKIITQPIVPAPEQVAVAPEVPQAAVVTAEVTSINKDESSYKNGLELINQGQQEIKNAIANDKTKVLLEQAQAENLKLTKENDMLKQQNATYMSAFEQIKSLAVTDPLANVSKSK